MRRRHISEVTEKCNALFALRSGYYVRPVSVYYWELFSLVQCKIVSLCVRTPSVFLKWNISRSCRNKPDNFCYICGELTTKERKLLPPLVRKAYELYFGCKVGQVWAPGICCNSSSRTMIGWLKGTPFAVPTVWREPRNHLDDVYFCITNIACISVQSKHKIENPNIPSALRPIPHDDSMPVPKPPEQYTPDSEPE